MLLRHKWEGKSEPELPLLNESSVADQWVPSNPHTCSESCYSESPRHFLLESGTVYVSQRLRKLAMSIYIQLVCKVVLEQSAVINLAVQTGPGVWQGSQAAGY